MIDLHFMRPLWLLALLPMAWLVWRMINPPFLRSNWNNVCDPHLLPHILHQPKYSTARFAPWLIALPGSLLILAIAGPVWQQRPQPIFNTQSALVLLLDLSRSMDATDLKPNRLTHAKRKVFDILHKHQEGQISFLVFAGKPFVVTPLTHDTATISSQLSSLDTTLMPAQGSHPHLAVEKAADLLRQGGIAHGNILLVTDEWRGSEQIARKIALQGHTLSILGVGTTQGASIPLPDGGFLQDMEGTTVITKLNEDYLRTIALLGGGRYQTLRTDDQDIETLLTPQHDPSTPIRTKKTAITTDRWYEEGPWIVLLTLPLIALAARKNILFSILLLLGFPEMGHTLDWESLWKNPDQRAMEQLQAGKAKQSANLFNNRAWKAVAHYRANQFQQAIANLQDNHSVKALYNKGNSLARLGMFEASAQAFTEVLARQPDHADARHNLKIVQQAMPSAKNRQTTKQGSLEENKVPKKSDAENHKRNKVRPEKLGVEKTTRNKQNRQGDRQPIDNKQARQSKEFQLATKQWLRRVPDDPGGLLRRKFRYQYQREYLHEAQGTGTQERHPW